MRTPIIIIGLIILVIVILTQSLYTVDETKQVIVLQMGEYKRSVTDPGLHFKIPFVQSVKSLDKRVLTATIQK